MKRTDFANKRPRCHQHGHASRWWLVSWLWLLILPSLVMAEAQPKKLVVGYALWPPFTLEDERGQLSGVDIEILTQALADYDYSIEFQKLPFTRRLQGLSAGTVDVVNSATLTSDRAAYAYFSEPYYSEKYQLYVRPEDHAKFANKSLNELLDQGFQIGIERGSSYDDSFNTILANSDYRAQIHAVPSMQQNYRKLLSNRIDGFIHESSSFTYQQAMNHNTMDVVPLLSSDEVYQHFMFSKISTNEQLLRDFNEGLKKLRESGEYTKIFQRHAAEPWMLSPPGKNP
ncbi:transporter substrate-binding domain-containing protein [Halioxenophilus sp. WMMB6]|uniref:substrate-binding periplasmic protein n=1 Tax=Halioxenophilus sp. WMMB6 TaxID=3073815 RepID=UPI00295F0470|nr:transporter substrate-binding domain-containing protein [Halioxenophilus sp. WMMB6]